MAIKPKGRPDDDELDEEIEDDDLADDQTEDTEQDDTEDEADDDESKAKGKKKETNEERLARELDQAKKALRAANRKEREARDKLTKAGITDKDDPEDIKAQLQQIQRERDQLRVQQREAQTKEAIRDVLNSDEKYTPYQKSVKYILTELDLTEDDLDPDTGKYDKEVLEEAAQNAVERYVRNAPKPAEKRGGSGASNGVGGEPLRSGANNSKESVREREARLSQKFGVNLDY